MKLLEGKTALVTGGATGIGASIVRRFAQEGAFKIAIADIDLNSTQALADELEKMYDCEILAIKASVSNMDDVNRCFKIIIERMGNLDILVNNAGVCEIVDIDDITMERWDRTYDINVKGAFLFARGAMRLMKTQQYGSIVNMASQAGKIGGLMVGVDYSSSKGAVLALTKSLAKVGAQYNITVNSIAPGLIATGMTDSFGYDPNSVPLGRIGTPEEVADAVLFAASDLSRYITGACFDVNGGMSMW